MASAPSTASELRRLGIRRRGLLAEAGLMVVSASILVGGAGDLEGSPLDLQFLFLAATGLFSLASVHVVDQIVSILHADCPRCASRFFGDAPEHLPSPLRSRCCHCGIALSDAADAS